LGRKAVEVLCHVSENASLVVKLPVPETYLLFAFVENNALFFFGTFKTFSYPTLKKHADS